MTFPDLGPACLLGCQLLGDEHGPATPIDELGEVLAGNHDEEEDTPCRLLCPFGAGTTVDTPPV